MACPPLAPNHNGGANHPVPEAARHGRRDHGAGHHEPWEAQVSWAEIFEHQKRRQALVEEWLKWLDLRPGDHLVDLGAGPGLTSLLAARRVRPHGRVYAVDHWPEALGFLRRQVEQEGLDNVHAVQADIAQDDLAGFIPPRDARKVVLAHVLHHVPDPRTVLGRLHRWLLPGARMVVAEFAPEGAGEVGPPREERLAEADLAEWLTGEGFKILGRQHHPEQEQYAILVERA